MSIRGRRHEIGASIVGELRGDTDAGEGQLRRLARFKVRFAPIAWLFGVGFAGFGIGGFRGAGIALMLPATVVFVAGLVDPTDDVEGRGALRARKRTLRHRYYLWLDQLRRKREHRQRTRHERKDAERDFLERRNRRDS
jgi:hypothetical protein